MTKEKAYKIISGHIFCAYRTHCDSCNSLIILSDNIEDAEKLAKEKYGTPFVTIKPIKPTDNLQIYEI